MSQSAAISAFTDRYATAKQYIGDLTGASEDLLHVHVGLAIFVLSALLLRKKFRSHIPLSLVFLFAIGNEVIDLIDDAKGSWLEHGIDILNTVFWPILLFLLARRWR